LARHEHQGAKVFGERRAPMTERLRGLNRAAQLRSKKARSSLVLS